MKVAASHNLILKTILSCRWSMFLTRRSVALIARTAIMRNGRNRVFENQEILTVSIEENRKFIKAFKTPGERRAVHQMNRDNGFLAPQSIKKSILNVLRTSFFHSVPPLKQRQLRKEQITTRFLC